MPASLLSLQNIQVDRDGVCILDIPALEVRQGEILAIIGPNGAGKTTLMMAISGLIALRSGEILYAGHSVRPYHDLSFRRRLALVMQSPLLLHTSVYQNIAAGLNFRNIRANQARSHIEDWLEKLSIAHLKDRSAHKLSGGEAQRVSLARAFVLQPDLMLLDEPFSALDAPTRAQLLIDLKKLLSATHTTTLFITHDLDEALALADRVAVLIEGRLRQVGTPPEVFSAPADTDIARFTGVEAILPGKVLRQQDGLADIECDHLTLQAVTSAPVGAAVYLCLRPEDITLSLPGANPKTSARNTLRGTIEVLVPQGPLVRVTIAGTVRLTALITRASAQEMELSLGQEIQASFKSSAIHVIQA
jgi:molybdopterin-binding protein